MSFFLNRHHHTTADASTPTLTQPTTQRRQHILTHTNTYLHILYTYFAHHPFPAQIQVHVIPSGTRFAQLCHDSCFLHDANMFGQGMGHGPRTLTLRQVRAVFTEREPTGRVISVIVAEREDKREESREREREEYEGREQRERERPPVCRFKTSRVYVQQRAHVFNMRAFCWYTRRRFEPTHCGFPRAKPRHTHNTHTTPHAHITTKCLDMCLSGNRP